MSEPLSPAVVADIDQTRALLRDLVGYVRTHRAEVDCEHPEICVGGALYALPHLSFPETQRLLRLALIQLADTPDPQLHAWP